MNNWLESVYSDGTKEFVSNPSPVIGETVRVRLRMYDDAPVLHVFVRSIPNGAEHLEEAEIVEQKNGLKYYEAPLYVNENRVQYQFYLVCHDVVYFYTQKQITTYVPDHTYDFVLLADYKQPGWVKKAVFYQIFPERFCNGTPLNDVQDGEYEVNGYQTIHMKNWSDKALNYEEGHCLDFYGGDLEGVRQKIPYLKKLGVNAIYLNPIFEAPSAHKYDCVDYLHVDPHFGGDEALAALSKELHDNGMRLILDISINHTGTSHKWFLEGRKEYYFFHEDGSYDGWFGNDSLPVLNYTSDALRDAIYRAGDSVLKKWLKPPYSIDGWRFDVADVFARNDKVQLANELWPEIRKSIREENEEAYILAEDWGDCAHYLQGDMWDSPMNYYGCGRVIRQFLGEPDLFMARNSILCQVPYRMTAEDVRERVMEHLAKLPYVIWENQFNLFDSHDVSRLHNNPAIDERAYHAAILFLFTMVGAASIYYGDEASIGGVTGTNEGCRYPMPWHEPFEEKQAYKTYQRMSALKAKHPALSEGGMKFLYAKGQIVSLARFAGEEVFVTILSTSERDEKIRLPLGSVGKEEPMEAVDIFGEPLLFEKGKDGRSVEIMIKAGQSYFFQCK